jgi:hypothetical protein
MAANGVNFEVLMRCEWPDAVKTIVRDAEAVRLLYRDVLEKAIGHGTFKIINVAGPNLSVISYIMYSKERPLSQCARDFLAFLRAARQNDSSVQLHPRELQSDTG